MTGGEVVEVHQGDLDRPYEVVGRVSAPASLAKKLGSRPNTLPSRLLPPPEREVLNMRLGEEAFNKYSANAVIHTRYLRYRSEEGVDLVGEGVAVIFDCQCEHSSGVFWGDRCVDCAGRRRGFLPERTRLQRVRAWLRVSWRNRASWRPL
jgi:hypothetical protein